MKHKRKYTKDLNLPDMKPGTTCLLSLLAFYLVICQSITVNAQPQSQPQPQLQPQTDSLSFYIGIAVKNNPSLKQKFYEYHASLKRIPQAGSLPDPELSLGVFLTPMELVSGKQVADIRLMQMFPWFGVLKNAKDEMSNMANAKYELFEDSKLQIIYEVQREWYEINKIQNKIRITEKSLNLLKTIEQLAITRFRTSYGESATSVSQEGSLNSSFDINNRTIGSASMQSMGNNSGGNGNTKKTGAVSGMTSGSMPGVASASGLTDVYRIQIEIGEVNNNLYELKELEKKEVAVFNSYLNRSALIPIVTDDFTKPDTTMVLKLANFDTLLYSNPMLNMLEYEEHSYEARKKMVTAMGLPMVGLGLNYAVINKVESPMSTMNGKDMIMPMLTLTLPVYRKKYSAMKEEADLMKNSVSQGYQATINSLKNEYIQALQLYNDSDHRLKHYDNQYQLALKSYNISLINFTTSGTSLEEILKINREMLDYETKQTEAAADIMIAGAMLRRLCYRESDYNFSAKK